jgi:hypothetical protein
VSPAPVLTGSAASVFTTDRSARDVTPVVSVSVLFPGTGSDVVEPAVAVFVIVPPSEGAVASIAIAAFAPEARLGRVHTIWPAAGGLHVHPVPDPLAPVTPAGSVSVTVTALAVSGPAFATVIV